VEGECLLLVHTEERVVERVGRKEGGRVGSAGAGRDGETVIGEPRGLDDIERGQQEQRKSKEARERTSSGCPYPSPPDPKEEKDVDDENASSACSTCSVFCSASIS
jgi:hypothetical protein